MKKQIALQDTQVTYTLRKSRRARRMRLTVYCDGAVVVTGPLYLPEFVVERFIREKSQWLFSKIAFFREFPRRPVVVRYSRRDYKKYKHIAHKLVVERINHFNSAYKFNFKRISIKNQKTRWGSCSKKGNLNFSYKIALLPPRLSDYIIVHELCHLGEFNHSRKFWNLVEKSVPDYLSLRNKLKRS